MSKSGRQLNSFSVRDKAHHQLNSITLTLNIQVIGILAPFLASVAIIRRDFRIRFVLFLFIK